MDKNELKTQALLERLSQIVTDYEDKIADFRADATIQLTNLTDENNALKEQKKELEAKLNEAVEKAATNIQTK